MLENLKQLIKENAQDAIVKNSEVPNEQNEAAIDAASGSIMDAFKQQLSSGNVNNLVDAFKGGNVQNSAVAQDASSNFIDKLGSMGINLDSAKGIAASLIPAIMDKFVKKTNDPNDNSFDLNDVLSNISGADGKFQLSDLTNLIGGKNENGNQNTPGGDVIDKLKGFFS